LNTDIEGSTALLRRLGDQAYAKVLSDHHRIVRSALETYGGHEVGTNGDSFFATFSSPSACVASVVEMQRALDDHSWPAREQLRVRMGVHTGEASQAATGLVGYEVHRAARIAAVAHGGQVLLSSSAAALVENSLSADVGLRDLGSHRLKDLGRPETLFQLVIENLRSDFPPLRSLDNPDLANNLPVSLSSFVGRNAELAEVRSLILDSRLVTLIGSGGSGKTRLALQAVAELIDGSYEGVWFVELASANDEDQVPTVVISTLQLRQMSDCSPLDSLINTLRGQHVLIVLDNCEHVINAVAKLADLIGRSCPKVTIVATSREPLGVDGERVYRVQPLSLPLEDPQSVEDPMESDAVELFVTRARSHDSSFVLDASVAPLVVSICRRLDGIPLAIELAASRTSSISLEALHDRLDQRFRLLTGGSRNALPRQQTLGAMVAWSYDLLTEPEREVLRLLAMFSGSFDLKAAEAVCTTESIDAVAVVDLVSSLVNKSLVNIERSSTALRYRLLETIRRYAVEQFIQVGGEAEMFAAIRRHAEYFLRFCEEAAPELIRGQQIEWLRRLDLEWGNLQAAFNYFESDPARVEELLRLGVAGAPFFSTRQHQSPTKYIREALESGRPVPTSLRARALLSLGVMIEIMQIGERANAVACDLCADAVQLARELHDLPLEVEALVYLAGTSWHTPHRKDLALMHAQGALEIAREIDNPRLLGQALMVLGLVQDSPKTSQAYYLEALVKLREAGDLNWVCSTLVHLSNYNESDPEIIRQSKAFAEQGTELAEALGSTFHSTMCWSNHGSLCFLLGEIDEAERDSRRALQLARRYGGRLDFVALNIFILACSATRNEDFVRGGQLTGIHEAIDEQLSKSRTKHWSPEFIEVRDQNRARLTSVLGNEFLDRARTNGAGLSLDQLIDVALEQVHPAP